MELEMKEAPKIVVRIIFIGLLRLRLRLKLKLRERECFQMETTASAVYLFLLFHLNCVARAET
jgi:hypothetical protein